MAERITWERSEGIGRSGWTGSVPRPNGPARRLFSIEWSASRRGQWVLRTQLPFVIANNRDLNEDAEELKRIAEGILFTFVRSLGASFDD